MSIARRATRSNAGIYLVPEDRKRSGLILDFPIADNITLANLPAYAALRHDRSRAPSGSEAEQQRASSTSGCPDATVRRRLAVRRQPAEGRARQMAVDVAARASSSTNRRAASMSAPRTRSTG